MPVEVSVVEVAGLGALVAVAIVLALSVLVGLLITRWCARRASLFRSFGIERTDSGSVQFKGLLNSKQERAEEETLLEQVFGPTKFDRDEDSQPVEPEQRN